MDEHSRFLFFVTKYYTMIFRRSQVFLFDGQPFIDAAHLQLLDRKRAKKNFEKRKSGKEERLFVY
jgi:hypothetical protein